MFYLLDVIKVQRVTILSISGW